MKGWIELGVLCHTESSSQLEELGLDFMEYRAYNKSLIQVSNINCIQKEYSEERQNGTLIYLNGECIEVEETYEEIIELIKNN